MYILVLYVWRSEKLIREVNDVTDQFYYSSSEANITQRLLHYYNI